MPNNFNGSPSNTLNRILSHISPYPYSAAEYFNSELPELPVIDFTNMPSLNSDLTNNTLIKNFLDLTDYQRKFNINTTTLPASMLPKTLDINSINVLGLGKNLANKVLANSSISPVKKFLGSVGLNYDKWKAGLGAANTVFTGLFGEKSEYSGEYGDVTLTLDNTYDTVLELAESAGSYGKLISLGMGANKFLGNVANKIGAGTDAMTNTDAILGSSFLLLTPLGLVNGFGGRRANTFTKDTLALETVGTSYTGSSLAINDALSKSGKKYGLFSSGARKRANRLIAEAKRLQSIITDIADNTMDRRNILSSMAAINGNNYAFQLQGGYDLGAVRVGRKGLKIDRAREILDKYKKLLTNQLQHGGSIDPFEEYLNSLPENLKDSTNFRVKDYWLFNGKPKDFKEAVKKGMFTLDKLGLFHAKSIAENPETGEIEYMKDSSHPTRYMESDWYEKGLIYTEDLNGNTITVQLKPGVPGYEDWKQFTNDYELVKSGPYWKYIKRLLKKVPSHKNGGTFIEISIETSIELVDPMSIPEFLNGGSINVIPDGALHARKHNMEMDGITKKGIPVVSESNGEIEQQAEIEKEEIIFRLEVTLKLEELEKKFYSEESTQEEKDECALEAGKLLVNEILYNTLDNTNNLL